MKDVIKKFNDLYDYLELQSVVSGEYKDGELYKYVVLSYHPFVLFNTTITKNYTQVTATNRFNGLNIFTNTTSLQEASELISLVVDYFEKYVRSKVIK